MRPQRPYCILLQWLEKIKVSQDIGDFHFFSTLDLSNIGLEVIHIFFLKVEKHSSVKNNLYCN